MPARPFWNNKITGPLSTVAQNMPVFSKRHPDPALGLKQFIFQSVNPQRDTTIGLSASMRIGGLTTSSSFLTAAGTKSS